MNARLILIALLLVLVLPAQAQDRTYNSVKEILAETRFRIVDLETYKREIRTGKVVGFFFSEVLGVDGPNGLLAKVFKETMGPFTGLKFVAHRRDPSIGWQQYTDMGFTGTPAYAIYHNGERLFVHNGGPSDKRNWEKELSIMRNNFREQGDKY